MGAKTNKCRNETLYVDKDFKILWDPNKHITSCYYLGIVPSLLYSHSSITKLKKVYCWIPDLESGMVVHDMQTLPTHGE